MRRTHADIVRDLQLAKEARTTAEQLMVRAHQVVINASKNHEEASARVVALEQELDAYVEAGVF